MCYLPMYPAEMEDKKNASSQASAKSAGGKVEALKFRLNSLGGSDELRF